MLVLVMMYSKFKSIKIVISQIEDWKKIFLYIIMNLIKIRLSVNVWILLILFEYFIFISIFFIINIL